MLTLDHFEELQRWPRADRIEVLFGLSAYDFQRDILNDATAAQKAWNAGRRAGKTTTASAVPALWVIEHADEDAAVFAPSAKQADEMFRLTRRYLDTAVPAIPGLSIETANKTEYELSNGSRAYSLTLGNETSRGRGPSCVVVDEAALVPYDTIPRVVQPMLLDHEEYELWLCSTPRGKGSYFHEACENLDSFSTHHATAYDKPTVDHARLDAIKAEVSAVVWKTEYLAQFADDGDSFLPESVVDPCVAATDSPATPSSRVWVAVDPARRGADASAYVAIDSTGTVFYADTVATETVPETIGRMRDLDHRLDPRAILVDNSQGVGETAAADPALSNVCPFKFSLKAKHDYYTNLSRLLEGRDISLAAGREDTDALVRELTNLEYSYTSSSNLRIHARGSGHDDLADAAALAAYGYHHQVAPAVVGHDELGPIYNDTALSQKIPHLDSVA